MASSTLHARHFGSLVFRREEIIFHVPDIIQDIRNVFLIEKSDDSEGK